MGVCINYRGSLKELYRVHELMDEIEDICKTMDWSYHLLDENWNEPSTIKMDNETSQFVGNAGLKGIAFNPHPDCETVNLLFDKDGVMSSITQQAFVNMGMYAADYEPWQWFKTQFAGVDVHIGMVRLFRYIKEKYVTDMEVNDETGYWESNNREDVERCMGIIDAALDMIEGIANSSESLDDFLAKLDTWLVQKGGDKFKVQT